MEIKLYKIFGGKYRGVLGLYGRLSREEIVM